jgi:UDP-N-acetylmuramate dehydrogenase
LDERLAEKARKPRGTGLNGRDLESRLVASLPKLRGRLKAETPLKDLTWFRAGGPAEVLYSPADEADLAYFLSEVPAAIPVTVIGLGSNLLVRDGGIEGVVIRLGRGFGEVAAEDGFRVRAGAAVPDVKVARAAAEAGIAGLSFYRGIPGCVGGALRMNGGAHGRETKEVLVEARAVDRKGNIQVLPVAALDYAYRHCGAPDDVIFTEALFQGAPGEPAKILAEMDEIAAYREEVQPIKSRTGGSTFKNPPGHKAWQLIDRAGCRGLNVGDAKVSAMHCNFLINEGNASGADLETLGETVRARVKETSGVELEWEIKRLGIPA